MEAARNNPISEKPKEKNWSVLDGEFDPEITQIDDSLLEALGVHVRNSGDTVNVYMAILNALQVSNPELMSDEVQKVQVENDLINIITRLSPDEYPSSKLDELRRNVPEFETAPPPVIQALEAIFTELQEKAAREEWKKVSTNVKSRAYSAIRGLYLLQTGQADKIPAGFKRSGQ